MTLSTEEIERQARLIYIEHTGNHPTIHCNRFPTWDELNEEHKNHWRRRVLRDI